jgi:hypothetical protein
MCVRAAVIEKLKDEAAKRGGDLELEMKADDGDKKKWMSTAQLWVDPDAESKVNTFAMLCSSFLNLIYHQVLDFSCVLYLLLGLLSRGFSIFIEIDWLYVFVCSPRKSNGVR